MVPLSWPSFPLHSKEWSVDGERFTDSNPMKEKLLTAIDESVALATCPTVEVTDVEAAAHWLKRNQWDVDWDNIEGTITIFGDRPSKSDEPENWCLYLVESINA